MKRACGLLCLLGSLLAAACAPSSGPGLSSQAPAERVGAGRTLIFVHGGENLSYAMKEIQPAGGTTADRSPPTTGHSPGASTRTPCSGSPAPAACATSTTLSPSTREPSSSAG